MRCEIPTSRARAVCVNPACLRSCASRAPKPPGASPAIRLGMGTDPGVGGDAGQCRVGSGVFMGVALTNYTWSVLYSERKKGPYIVHGPLDSVLGDPRWQESRPRSWSG